MKISYEWLKDYVEIVKTPEKLAKDLSLFGHEVESVEKIGDDYVLDFEITPNRGDCLSILGLAREIAALYKTKLQITNYEVKTEKIDKKIDVKIVNPQLCPRFTARIIDNITIGESPKRMQGKLATYGFRPINNIVDITNFAMVATGQPLHAFDYDKIQNGLMNIRQAKKGEEVMTLDGQNRVLNEGAIIIEDEEKIYDLAGIMGGINSEVDDKTKTIVLQGAIFDPILIRKASKYLNHITDASYRYERGVDFEKTIAGVDMAASLIKESCPEAKIGELIDIKSKKPRACKIEHDMAKVNKLLGTNIQEKEAQDYLTRLGFKINDNIVFVPSFREYDVKIWQDLAEEIARVYGYNNLAKNNLDKEKAKENEEFIKTEYIKDILANLGFVEIYSYSFIDQAKIPVLGYKIEELVQIEKPLSPETEYLRPSLLGSLLNVIAKNPWAPEVNIFEIEKVFTPSGEKLQLGLASTGKKAELLWKAIETLNLKTDALVVEKKLLDKYKIRRPVNYALFSLDDVNIASNKYTLDISHNKYHPISRYAPTVRDLAFIVEKDIDTSNIIEEISKNDGRILLVELFDEFVSEKFGPNKKNVAFHIWLQEKDQPMKDEDIEEILKKIISVVADKFGGKLRSEEFK